MLAVSGFGHGNCIVVGPAPAGIGNYFFGIDHCLAGSGLDPGLAGPGPCRGRFHQPTDYQCYLTLKCLAIEAVFGIVMNCDNTYEHFANQDSRAVQPLHIHNGREECT